MIRIPLMVAVVLVALSCAASLPSVAAETARAVEQADRAGVFVVGRVSADARRTQPRLDAMANYLAGKLADHGYRRGAGLVAASEAEMIRLLREGRVDMVSETPLSAVRLSEATGAEIALREWKGSAPVYHGVIVVRRDSPIYTVRDLRGQRIALEDRGSTTGFLLPLAAIRAAGLPVVPLASHVEEVPPDSVGFVFAANELSISAWVARGLVEAGGYSDADFNDNDRTPRRVRSDLRQIYMSQPVVRSVALLRTGLRADIRDSIVAALLAIDRDDGAADVRREYYKLRRFDRLDDAARASLDDVRRQATTLGELLN